MSNPQEGTNNAGVIGLIHVDQSGVGVHGFQGWAGVIPWDDLGGRYLGDDETGGKETKQGCTEQHCVGWGSRMGKQPGGIEEAGGWDIRANWTLVSFRHERS